MEKLTELEDALLRLGQRAVCHEGLRELYRGLRGCLPEDVQMRLSTEEPSEQFQSSVPHWEQIRRLKRQQFLAAASTRGGTPVAQTPKTATTSSTEISVLYLSWDRFGVLYLSRNRFGD